MLGRLRRKLQQPNSCFPSTTLKPAPMASLARMLAPFTAAGALRAPAVARAAVAAMTTGAAQPQAIYELRWYDIHPGHFRDFIELTKAKIHLRTAVSPLVGYWTCELGGLNQTVHIWKYDSFAHRTNVRAALGKNEVWMQSYMERMWHWLAKQNNSVMTPILSREIPAEIVGATYELRTHRLKPGTLPQWRATYEELVSWAAYPVVGAWANDFGGGHTVHELLQYPSLDHRTAARAALNKDVAFTMLETRLQDLVVESHSKHLSPLPFSPLR